MTTPNKSPEPSAAYDMLDRFLRNNLGDDDYAEYSAALDALTAPPAQPAQCVPVAKFIEQANALLSLDAANALAPHGIGGFARELLTEAIRLLAATPATAPAQEPVTLTDALDVLSGIVRDADSEPDGEYLEGANKGCVAVHRKGIERARAIIAALREKQAKATP